MPRDLFGDVVVRPASSRPRRSPLLLLSLGAHGAALLLGVVGSLVATGALPSPRSAVAYQEAMFTVPAVDIELPSQHRHARPARRASSHLPAPVVFVPAPVDAPNGIAPENPEPGVGGVTVGADLASIEQGDGGSIDGLVPGTPLQAEPQVTQQTRRTEPAIRLHSGIRAPQKIFNVDPAYPAIARSVRVEGVVILEAIVDTSGTITGLRVLRSVALLDQAAVDAVRQWRFKPALLNGDPVNVIMTITVRFALGEEPR
jgi:protein TonB